MTEAPGFFPCTSRVELRQQKQKEKEEQETAIMDQVKAYRHLLSSLLETYDSTTW